MARSLIGGLLDEGGGQYRITAADPDPGQCARLAERFGVPAVADNLAAIEGAEVVVLAVKPQSVRNVALEIAERLAATRPLVVSIAAGVREPDIRRWLGYEAALVRCMPNTPALVRSGASALYANPAVSAEQREVAESLLRAVGTIVWVDEEADLDAVTALSGSGPAYFFAVMEALEAGAVDLGLAPEQARLLTIETAFGAARMALEAGEAPAELRVNVTSPGGTTEAALAVLTERGLADSLRAALAAAHRRARELGEQLGGQP